MHPGPELLLPAGTPEKMHYALSFGADAVYAGLPRYSLRARKNAYQLPELEQGISAAHAIGKRFYVTANLMAHNTKLSSFERDMTEVIALAPDALIMADPGLIALVRNRWPDLPIHLSVQANTVNWASVRFWQGLGLRRIILSRELALGEIAEIRQRCPEIELEVFVHGALCIAYSGRCLLSGYFNHRDANQGTCTNACRWEYRLEESQRPGEYFPIEEDEHGTYILNSRDLNAVRLVAELVEIGVDALKIEGRTKSAYYVARTARAYRQAIDAARCGHPLAPTVPDELERLANRGYTEGFLRRHADAAMENLDSGESLSDGSLLVGSILPAEEGSTLSRVRVRNRFAVGDSLELMQPQGSHLFRLEQLWDDAGNRLQQAPGDGWVVRMQLPVATTPHDLLVRTSQPSCVK